MGRVPARDQQDELQHRLAVLLNDWDGETTPAGQEAAAEAVRQAAWQAAGESGRPMPSCCQG